MRRLPVGFLMLCWPTSVCWAEMHEAGLQQTQTPVVWRLSDEPLVQIGVVAGDPVYELHRATSSIRQSDGRIVVADVGSREIRAFGPDGRHAWTAGGRGEGPGEFRWLGRVLPFAGDSLIIHDFAGDRLTVFDSDGQFGRTDSLNRSHDPDFPLVVWLYRQYWLDGPRDQTQRETVKHALDRLPIPSSEPAYRFARVDDDLNIWVRSPSSSRDTSREWTVFDVDAHSIAVVHTPLRFDVHEIGVDYVLGRWLDEEGVNFIHLYRLERTEETAVVPSSAPRSVSDRAVRDAAESDQDEASVEVMNQAMRALVMAQEMYFANQGEYSSTRHGLDWEGPEGVGMDIINAAPFGWTAVFTHGQTRTICGVFVGAAGPPGWTGEAVPKCR